MENGENSRKTRISDEEKPLKKARYVWEVKGKHHLKENNNYETVQETTEETPCSSSNSSEECCISSFLTRTEEIMDNEDLESTNNDVPISLVSNESNQDYYLRKWQARQIARGFVDNTINSVLENWNNPLLDPSSFVENYENLENVQDEGILMAIQFHGLQNGTRRENEEFQRENVGELNKVDSENENFEDTMDFLNAAVSVAIEKKGLSYT